MRKPGHWRAIALAVLPLGALLVLAANRQEGQSAGLAFGLPGLCLLAFGVVAGLWAHRAARAQARLQRGQGVLARWRVDAATWRAFRERERNAGAGGNALPDELSMPDDAPVDGIEVIVGEDAVAVGDSVLVLPRHGTPEVLEADLRDGGAGPHFAELRLRHPPTPRRNGGMNPAVHTRLAIPLPASAWRDARRAIGFYARGRPGKASFFHGRGDGSDADDLSTCGGCGYQTHVYRSTCPQCGAGMLSKRWARRFGFVLVVLGSVLAIGMGILLAMMSPLLAQPGAEIGGTRFTGTRMEALGIWAILAAVFVFGATAAATGAWQVATGKRNLRAAGVMLGIFSALVVAARLLS